MGDNTDIIIMTEALKLVKKKLVNVLSELASFADRYKDLPTLAFTHFQPAQPTTVGKRAALWMQEFCLDLEDLDHVISTMKLLGSKGPREPRLPSWSCLTGTWTRSTPWIP